MSAVSWAIPSMRHGFHSTGETRRRRESPKFFIARTVPAMLTQVLRLPEDHDDPVERAHGRAVLRRQRRPAGRRISRPRVGARGEAAEEDARGAHVVAHVDQQDRQVARAPEDGGEHDAADDLGEEREEAPAPSSATPATTSAVSATTTTIAAILKRRATYWSAR